MRSILLDTHVFLWSQFETGKLSRRLLALFKDQEVRWYLNQVSVWETQIKFDLGKLPLPAPPVRLLPELIQESGIQFETLSNEAIFMLGKLPEVHRDPFDRLLIATALVNGWEVATVDPVIEKYPVRIVQ
jgi:PIN domain nuclease of toxin-antitoxin system